MALNQSKFESIPQMPTSPEHPERPPRNIPIPGEPTFSVEERKYKCKKCGKVFNSKEELQVHVETDHARWIENARK